MITRNTSGNEVLLLLLDFDFDDFRLAATHSLYLTSAFKRIPKSSSSVHDVLLTRRAGRLGVYIAGSEGDDCVVR